MSLDKELLRIEGYLKHNLNFKKKFNMDRSGYWYEKTYKCRFFSAEISIQDGNWITITLYNGKKNGTQKEQLDIYSVKNATLSKMKEINSHFKKQSSEIKIRQKSIKKNKNGIS